MNISLYGNGGSGNHGCEAIVRGTVALLGANAHTFHILSENPREDESYGLGQLAEISAAVTPRKKDFRFLAAYAKLKFTGNYVDMDGLYYLPGIRYASRQSDIALSVGGDNYCYGGTGIYEYLNRAYRKRGVKTVLWGCSIEPDVVAQKNVAKDLASYDLITARESITYAAVRHVQKNTVFMPDPAFFMPPKECLLDERMHTGEVIGINISPMILSNEKAAGMAYANYTGLIRYLLSETDAAIALIPHVVWASNDDRKVLGQLYEDFDRDPRLFLVADHTAPELKYILSKCSFFVGARTHATIAAYASCVPTLAVGYSVKARGIAKDLFGTEDGYVLNVQDLTNPGQLTAAFEKLYGRKNAIAQHLSVTMPNYLAKADEAKNAIKGLVHR